MILLQYVTAYCYILVGFLRGHGTAKAVVLPSNSDSERPLLPVSILDDWHLASIEAAGAVQDLMRVAVVRSSMRM